MSNCSSTEDLFAVEDTDSDATVDLSLQASSGSHSLKRERSKSEKREKTSKLSANSIHIISSSESEPEDCGHSEHEDKTQHLDDLNQRTVSDSCAASGPTVSERHGTSRKRDSSAVSASTDPRPTCRYGDQCYRKNPDHLREFRHPSTSDVAELNDKKRRLDVPCGSDSVRPKSSSTNSKATGKVTAPSSPAAIVDACRPFSFLLTKVKGIESKFNHAHAVDISDLLSPSLGILQRSAQFNYCIDINWLLSQYPPQFRSLPLLIVHGDKKEEKTDLDEDAMSHTNITLCQARLDIAFGTHHTKMMLLLYNDGLRVVVHTANLVAGDWAQKTQGVWVSPVFPKLPAPGGNSFGDSPTHFKHDLVQYLTAYRHRHIAEWIDIIKQHDLSSARVYLIGSVPGRHSGESKNHYGHLKLRQVLSQCCPDSVSSWPVIGQFSSIGSLGQTAENWVCGEWLSSLSTTIGNKTLMSLKTKPKLQLIFPSVDNVRNSLEGYVAGGSLPYSIHTARKQPWLNSFLHQWKSVYQGRSWASPHIKTYARVSPDSGRLAWFLVTSANLSKAAWGCLEKNGSQLMIRSYELGVLFMPPQFDNCSDGFATPFLQPSASGDQPLVFPCPYDLPPTPYTREDRPWIWDISYEGKPDSHGTVWSPS